MLEELRKGKKIVASIEARMGSTRLPGKVLMEVGGRPLLEIMIERVKRSRLVDKVVVTTTLNPKDEVIMELCKKIGVEFFRGSEDDVLGRVHSAHKMLRSDIVVSLCGDCPLIDPEIIDECVMTYLVNQPCDYVYNGEPPTYPMGMNVNVYPFAVLDKADLKGTTPQDREHTTWYFRTKPQSFKHVYVSAPPSLYFPELEVVLDEFDDYRLIKTVYEALSCKKPEFTCKDIIDFFKANPSALGINKNVKRTHVKTDITH